MVGSEKAVINLDPRTKIIFLLLINVAIYGYVSRLFIILFVLFAGLLLIGYKKYKMVLNFITIYSIIYIVDSIVIYFPNIIASIWGTLSIAFHMFLPFIVYGVLLFTTTSISDAAVVFDKMYMPNFITIPILVLFRFFPTIRVEARDISNAMKLRGLSFGIKSMVTKPLKTMEYMYVPLLFSLVKTGEELTIASLTRGLGLQKNRTFVNDVKMGIQDYIVIIMFLTILAISLY